ncbi:MAG: sigma-70 family RNA polymerase sigma factor [Opitutae bacterium]|nr:sigma-70 family RNA polymerase sigma factor [Opitutae bacterium]
MTPPASPSATDEAARAQAELLAAMARGDKSALARLYDLLSRPLYSLALRVTNDSAEAQDIVQDVFLQLWHKAADYSPARGSVFAWAATLTRNRAIDRVRMRKRRTEIVHASAADIPGGEAGAGESDSADILWIKEKAAAVRTALASLDTPQRSAIELAFFGGLTQQQIAERLGEPLGTVKARIRRGLLKLRETLSARL